MVCSPLFEPLAERVDEFARERILLARFEKLLAHVDQFDRGHGPRFDAAGQFEQRVLAALGVVAALETRRGGAQHHAGARRLRAHNGDVAPVVARRFLLLVAAVVLFVHHDQAQIPHRREDAGARPHYYRCPA